ncbi:MAG: hypothetical protein K0S01_2656 [Herbinix sp.]|jgi:hypothetical protein|nr:hypothetical protein [Herbinix sp.]
MHFNSKSTDIGSSENKKELQNVSIGKTIRKKNKITLAFFFWIV